MKQLLEKGVDPDMIPDVFPNPFRTEPKEKESLLLLAVKHGHEATVSVLLDHGADKNCAAVWAARHGSVSMVKLVMEVHQCRPDSLGPDGMTPLMEAAKHGHVEAIKYLLQIGADPNFRDFGNPPHGLTALCWAASARQNDTQAVQCLLDGGADVNPILPEGVTMYPVCAALQYKDTETANLLLEHMDVQELPTSVNYQKVLLSVAVACGSETLVQRLLEAGCSPNAKVADGGIYFGDGRTTHESKALEWAIYFHREKIVSLLLDHGVEADRHPLCIALEQKNPQIVKMLLDKGVEMDWDLRRSPHSPRFAADMIEDEPIKFMMDAIGDPTLGDIMMREAIMAVSTRTSLVKMLLDDGVKLTVPCDEEDASRLLGSAVHSGEEMLELLFQNGFEIPSPGTNGSHKALVAAIEWYNVKTLAYLVKKGFSLSRDVLMDPCPLFYEDSIRTDSIGRMAQSLTTLEEGEDILSTLISQGLDLNVKGYRDETCLHDVIKKKHTPGLTLLLKKGADPLSRDEKDEIPLSMAANQGYSKGIKVLLEYIPTRSTCVCQLRRDIFKAEAKSASDRKWKNVKRLQDFYQRRLNSSVKCECEACSYEKIWPRPGEVPRHPNRTRRKRRT